MSVNLSLFAGAGWQFFDNNGVPLAGGLLYTYAAGTTTPQTTYTTSAGNIANSNPIVLDSAGRVPNEIWLTSTLFYKFLLKTSVGTQIASYDNIAPSADSASLAASSGSSLIGFIQSGTGAVAETVQTKLRERLSVKDFGAKGDGSTDDTAAIQAALNAADTAGKDLYFPAGTYYITDTIQPSSSNNVSVSTTLYGDGVNTIIQWNGTTDLTKTMFGWYTAQQGSYQQAGINNMRFKGMGKVGYIVLFETTNTSTGATRRENENNIFTQVWFEGSKKALVMFGKYSIDTNAALTSDGNDINVDANTFDNCTFVNFEDYAVKLTGGNIYNTVFRNCFMWSGNSTNVTSANAKNYIFAVAAGMTVVQAGVFQRLYSTGNNDGTDRIACMRSAFGEFKVYGAQSEDCRVFNSNTEGSPDRPHYINGIYVNDSNVSPGANCIYNESASPITVDSCSFGHQAGATDYYRNVVSSGALAWNNSVTGKFKPSEMVLSSNSRKLSTFNGRRFNEIFPLNQNYHMNSWSVPAATYANATTADYYLNLYVKTLAGSSQGTLQQVTSALYNRVVPQLICTVVGSQPVKLQLRTKINVNDYAGNTIWIAVGGQHDGTFTSDTTLYTGIDTDSTGGAGGGTIFSSGNVFLAYTQVDLSASATYVQPYLALNKTGSVDINNFVVIPDETGMQAMLYGLAQQSVNSRTGLPVSFTADGLSINATGNTYTYTDTLEAGDSNFYLVSANHGNAGAETALVMAHAITATAYVSKVSNLSSGSGASITASAVGLVVSIAVDGTTRAFVKKIKLTDY